MISDFFGRKTCSKNRILVLLITAWSAGFDQQDIPAAVYLPGPVQGKMIDAGFLYGDSNYKAVEYASDDNVYYVVCSHNKKSGAQIFRYNSRTDSVKNVGGMKPIGAKTYARLNPMHITAKV